MDNDEALPPGFTVESDDAQAGVADLPAGFTAEGPDDSAAPTQAPTVGQRIKNWLNIPDERPAPSPTDTSPAAQFERNPTVGPHSDFGEWVGNKIEAALASPVNAAADLVGMPPLIDTTPSPGARRFQGKASSALESARSHIPPPAVRNPQATEAAIHGAENPEPGSIAEWAGQKLGDIGTIASAVVPAARASRAGELLPLEERTAVAPRAPYDDSAAAAQTRVLGTQPPVAAASPTAAPIPAGDTLSAARARPSPEGLHPESQKVLENAANVDYDAVERHRNADTLPMPENQTPAPLRKSQASRDGVQSDLEWNMRDDKDTQGLIRSSIDGQTKTMGLSMGEIRQRATPDIVHNTTDEHGQNAVDAIKAQDNAAILDTRAKYKALADQNGGVMPFETGPAGGTTGSTLGVINNELSKSFLTKTAATNPVISEVMDALESGKPINFEQFENARTNLAAVQRRGGNDAAAAGIVRNALENMPLPQGAQQLKGLADIARASAKSRFDIIKNNPAYAAVVDDDVPRDANGLHVIGAPSPLAPKFMENYFTGARASASPAYVARMKSVMHGNADFSDAVEAASLNKLRDSAGLNSFDEVPSGGFKGPAFRKTWEGMQNKAQLLMKPETAANVNQLRQYSDDVSWEPPASTKNRSNSAIVHDTLKKFGAQEPPGAGPAAPTSQAKQAISETLQDAALTHINPALGVARRLGSTYLKGRKLEAANRAAAAAKEAAERSVRDAKLNFAQDATARGAGIDKGVNIPGARASGGKVDHEVLVSRLMNRWHSARKHANKATEPLLNVPDEAITRALQIAHQSSQAHA